MKKRIIVITIIGLFLLMLPMTAGASIIDSGTCGDNLTWTFDNQGILTISGTGDMYDYSSWSTPWNHHTNSRDAIVAVIINDGVTRIGKGSLCISTLHSVFIPNSVLSIGNEAFNIQVSPKASLKTVYYGGTEAEWNSLSIGNNNTPLNDATKYFESPSHPNYLMSGDCGDNLTYVIGFDGALTISGYGDMYDYSWNPPWDQLRHYIKSVTLPNGITRIGNCAFEWLMDIATLSIPETVTSIGENAFYNWNELKEISIPNSVTKIEDHAFAFCFNLESITIPSSVTSIDSYAFSCCEGLKSVTIQNGTTSIGEGAFLQCTSLSSIIIPDSVKNLGKKIFAYSNNLESISISPSNAYYSFENGVLFDKSQTTLLWCSPFVEGKYVIPSTVSRVEDFAFCNCDKLTGISIPESVISIGDSALLGCTNIDCFDIASGNTSFSSKSGVLFNKNKTILLWCSAKSAINGYTIPNRVKEIADGAFGNCQQPLICLTIPLSVESIGANNFPSTFIRPGQYAVIQNVYYEGSEAQWENVSVGNNNDGLKNASINCNYEIPVCSHISVIDPAVAPTETTTGLTEGSHCSVCGEIIVVQVEIPAISDMTVLRLPSSLTIIEDEAFSNLACQAIIIPEGCTTIGIKAFAGCTNLLYVKIPASVKSYPTNAFEGCNTDLVIDWQKE